MLYEPWHEREQMRKQEQKIVNRMAATAVVSALVMLAAATCSTGKPEPKAVYIQQPPVITLTSEQAEYRDFFIRHGSPAPSEMAVAVTQTKRPALMSAIAVKESNGDPKAVGDSGASKGAFQVQEKHWGKVPSDAVGQALQAERILEELVQSRRGHLRRGLAAYNGGTRPPRVAYRYADHVLALKRGIN